MNLNVIVTAGLLAAVILIWLIMSYKGFLKLKYSVEEAFETTEVYLKKRHELVVQLVKFLKNRQACSQELLDAAAEAKTAAQGADCLDEKVLLENELSQKLGELITEAESCGGLAENQAFLKRKEQLLKAEDDIENFARFYNTLVKMLNTRVRSLPSNLIAKLFHFTMKPMMDAEIGSKRQ